MSHEGRVRVKICGVTNREDAELAAGLGADALGFNTYPGSRRFIDLREAGEWIQELPSFVTKVAVMVNPSLAEAEAVSAMPFIDSVQFHGDKDAEVVRHFAQRRLPFIKAIRLTPGTSLEPELSGQRDILLDAYSPGAYGGTGRLIDLELAEHFAGLHPNLRIILSGGLTPENVAQAVRRVRPFAVDVASGVESPGDPRRKDPARMAAFLRAAGR